MEFHTIRKAFIIAGLSYLVLGILILVLLASCNTQKKAVKHIAQAQARQPLVVRAACASYYPSKDSTVIKTEYKQGRTDTIIEMVENVVIDSIQVHDTIKGETKTITKERIVKVPIIKYLKQIDTFTDTKIISYENTAVIGVLNDRVDSLSEVVIVAKERLKTAKKTNNSLIGVLMLLSAAVGLYFAVKSYFNK